MLTSAAQDGGGLEVEEGHTMSDEEWVLKASDDEWAFYLMHLARHERPCDEELPAQPAEVSTGVYLGGLTEADAVAGFLHVDPENSSRNRLRRADALIHRARSLRIDSVLCMAPTECGPSKKRFHADRFWCLDIKAQDTDTYDIFTEDVPRGVNFIRSSLRDGGRVFVHCNGGRNRSVTVCAAWLLLDHRMMLVDVVRLMARRRGRVFDNQTFLAGLVKIARAEGLLNYLASTNHSASEQKNMTAVDEILKADASVDVQAVETACCELASGTEASTPIDAWDA